MKKYRAILKKVYPTKIETITEFDFCEDDNEDALNHLNRLVEDAKKKFDVDVFCVYLEEIR